MIYEYRCTLCEKIVEVEHPMSEVGNLSESTKQQLKCPGLGKCEFITEEDKDIVDKIEFCRSYNSVSFLQFNSLPVAEKQKILKKRASEDFKKNVEEKKRVLQGTAVKQMKDLIKKK